MPLPTSYPGVYVQELPSQSRAIAPVGATITAFIGQAMRGEMNKPTLINGFGDYERIFGGLNYLSTMSYAVRDYFLNGGSNAAIVRVGTTAGYTWRKGLTRLPTSDALQYLFLEAKSEGAWVNKCIVSVSWTTSNPSDTNLFSLIIKEYSYTHADYADVVNDPVVGQETIYNLSIDPSSPRYVVNVLEQECERLRVQPGSTVPTVRPTASSYLNFNLRTGVDGVAADVDYLGDSVLKKGIYALDLLDRFDVLCIPPITRVTTGGTGNDVGLSTWQAALAYCKQRRAMLVVDPPASWTSVSAVTNATTGIDGSSGSSYKSLRDENALITFPRVYASDPLSANRLDLFAACGAVAGVIAGTDGKRGIWKAPAGLDARLVGISTPAVRMTEAEIGTLNPLGVNAIRTMPGAGVVLWGSRTLEGADRLASDWKYLPVRRLALYIEESLYRGTQWAVFEPNDEPLWGQIRLNVGAFMHQLFRQGAFQGAKPSEAYFVKCDQETTTQNDINQGVVNVIVGFAPLKPAEFVIIKLQQIAGQILS